MSKGSERKTIRFGKSILEAIDAYLAKREKLPTVEPWTFSDFVAQAIVDKLNHIERSGKTNRKWWMTVLDSGSRGIGVTEKGKAEVVDMWTERDCTNSRIPLDEPSPPVV